MLEIIQSENTWNPPELTDAELNEILETNPIALEGYDEYLYIMRIEPYIDALYVCYDSQDNSNEARVKRYVFREGFCWNRREEKYFFRHCIDNPYCMYSYADMDRIYVYYSKKYSQWHLKRYYAKSLRLLDHIYNCCRQNTAKEMLYKSGLEELAFYVSEIDEINLLSAKPADIYEGVSLRSLRALNCEEGAQMLNEHKYRKFFIGLQSAYPDIFKYALNDAQCRYLRKLIDGDLTVGEAGRLYLARRNDLLHIWNSAQYALFTHEELQREKEEEELDYFSKMDPIYKEYIHRTRNNRAVFDLIDKTRIAELEYYLFDERENLDKEIRRSNRKRNPEWQERGMGYVVRYPQTINDFCREAIYMGNCLLTYLDAVTKNDTTILFMRKEDDVNKPFITIEVFQDELKQAYHRFNTDCTEEEAIWIGEYCKRHNISTGHFTFGRMYDDLF